MSDKTFNVSVVETWRTHKGVIIVMSKLINAVAISATKHKAVIAFEYLANGLTTTLAKNASWVLSDMFGKGELKIDLSLNSLPLGNQGVNCGVVGNESFNGSFRYDLWLGHEQFRKQVAPSIVACVLEMRLSQRPNAQWAKKAWKYKSGSDQKRISKSTTEALESLGINHVASTGGFIPTDLFTKVFNADEKYAECVEVLLKELKLPKTEKTEPTEPTPKMIQLYCSVDCEGFKDYKIRDRGQTKFAKCPECETSFGSVNPEAKS